MVLKFTISPGIFTRPEDIILSMNEKLKELTFEEHKVDIKPFNFRYTCRNVGTVKGENSTFCDVFFDFAARRIKRTLNHMVINQAMNSLSKKKL